MVLQSDDLLPTGSMPAPSQHPLTAFRDSATILPIGRLPAIACRPAERRS
jgi:hypothetical protein